MFPRVLAKIIAEYASGLKIGVDIDRIEYSHLTENAHPDAVAYMFEHQDKIDYMFLSANTHPQCGSVPVSTSG